MNVVDCKWELKNLGCRVAEVSVQDFSDFDDSQIREIEERFDYVVIKAETKDFRLYEKLSCWGYQFVEAQLSVQKNLNKFDVSSDKLVQYHMRHFRIEQINSESQFEENLSFMTPEMYNTDRIYLDPLFGPQYSLRRYQNWSMEEFRKGSPCFKMMYQDKCAGLAVLKLEGETIVGLLAGFFDKYQRMGLGIMIPTLPLFCEAPNCWLYKTNISSNNLPVIQMYIHHDYTFSRVRYVFIKHIA